MCPAVPQACGWATELCAGIDEDGYSCNSLTYLFTVTMTLTETGLHAGPGFGLAPVGLLFQYLRLLVGTGGAHAQDGSTSAPVGHLNIYNTRRLNPA